MTKSNNKIIPVEDRISVAREEFGSSRDIVLGIYRSRENEPNENVLIRNFYYSIYHLIKGISVLESGLDYSSHASLISYFNRENKKEGFLNKLGVKWDFDESEIKLQL